MDCESAEYNITVLAENELYKIINLIEEDNSFKSVEEMKSAIKKEIDEFVNKVKNEYKIKGSENLSEVQVRKIAENAVAAVIKSKKEIRDMGER